MDDGPRVLDPKNPFGESGAAAKARRRRNVVLALGLVAFVILIFVVTLVKLKGNVLIANHL
ncbi:MAG: hypothetical protein ACXU82_10295 [Caulobacteraceae bacterium]